MSEALEIPIYVEHGISEWYSPVIPGTGLHPRPGSAASLQKYFPQIDSEGWSSVYYPSRKGETVSGVHDRCAGFFQAFFQAVEAKWPDKHKNVILVSHAATTIALAHELVGDRNMPMRCGCCSLTELKRKQGQDQAIGGWEAVKVADGSHLKDGASRDWGFEDIEVANGEVVSDPGIPGSEGESEDPVGAQINSYSARM